MARTNTQQSLVFGIGLGGISTVLCFAIALFLV